MLVTHLIVCGPRVWPSADEAFVLASLRRIGGTELSRVFVGDATGVDSLAADWFRGGGVPVSVFRAQWAMYGRSAGVRRSAEMLDAAGFDAVVVAIAPRGGRLTVGTAHTVRLALRRGLRVVVVSPDGRCWYSPDECGWTAAQRRLDELEADFKVTI